MIIGSGVEMSELVNLGIDKGGDLAVIV